MLMLASLVLAAAVAQDPDPVGDPNLHCDRNFRTYSLEVVSVRGVTALLHASMPDEALPCVYWNVTYLAPPDWHEVGVEYHYAFGDKHYITFQMPKAGMYRANNYNCDGDPYVAGTYCNGTRNLYNGENPWVWISKQSGDR